MSVMVEQVAEALAQSFRDTVARVSGDSWEATGVTLPSKEVFERYARAAIGAMREPTDEMIDAAGPSYGVAFEDDYVAMIDAALK